MRVAISQPTFLPWIGYFHLIYKSDIFIFLDDVQFDKRSWQQRNKISLNENAAWLTVPVKSKGLFEQKINNVEIHNDLGWRKKHLNSIKSNYGKSVFFKSFYPIVSEIYNYQTKSLAQLNIFGIKKICSYLELRTKFLRSSRLNIKGSKSEYILNLCKSLNATEYITGASSKSYLKVSDFKDLSIEVEFQNFQPISDEKTKDMNKYIFFSLIDLGFNFSKEKIVTYIKNK